MISFRSCPEVATFLIFFYSREDGTDVFMNFILKKCYAIFCVKLRVHHAATINVDLTRRYCYIDSNRPGFPDIITNGANGYGDRIYK
jgi:hypothetical protein